MMELALAIVVVVLLLLVKSFTSHPRTVFHRPPPDTDCPDVRRVRGCSAKNAVPENAVPLGGAVIPPKPSADWVTLPPEQFRVLFAAWMAQQGRAARPHPPDDTPPIDCLR